jgi:hypothetical protein
LSFRATFCYIKPDYPLIRTARQLIRISNVCCTCECVRSAHTVV